MSRLKFAIYGNCQIGPLAEVLQHSVEFSQNYENVFVTPVNVISQDEEDRFAETIRGLDLFIHQHVLSGTLRGIRRFGTDRFLTRLKGGARAISFPSAYFTGYNPETIVWKDEKGDNLSDSFCNYHDLNVLNAYYHGLSSQECVSFMRETDYGPEFLQANVADSLDRLRDRERQIDVRISAFIEENWRKERLFFGFNHPSNSLLVHEANQILDRIGLPRLDASLLTGRPQYMAENNDVLFVYPSIRRHFALALAGEEILIRGQVYTLEEAVQGYFEYYSAHPELAQYNVHRYENSSDATLSMIASRWSAPCLGRWSVAGASTWSLHSQGDGARLKELMLRLEEKNRVIGDLQSRLDNLQSSLGTLQSKVDDLQPRLQALQSKVLGVEHELDTVTSSTTWRIAKRLHAVVDRALPPGTRRRRLAGGPLRLLIRRPH
jgi:Polysaccharide biosynthesis enzyme WcbI